jgi:predicted TIM-barrel fold metal-dependent hydrolase
VTQSKPLIVTLEEHYSDAAVVNYLGSVEGSRSSESRSRLEDLGELRLKEMDEAGIDIQVISHAAPGLQRITGDVAVTLAREANDRLAHAIHAKPSRFAAFASLPTTQPLAAADELERSVTRLGFKGAMVHGLTEGQFIDAKRFWPILERAAKLRAPIYIHPSQPHQAVTDVYYKDYSEYPIFARAACGFAAEGATQAIRLVLSGVLEAYPGLRFILGHFGETIPYQIWRIHQTLSRPGNFPGSFRDLFIEHFYITTSGFFSTPALLACAMEMGTDRILFSVDWPFVSNRDGVDWLNSAPLCDQDRRKILGENAKRLLCL